MDVEQRRRRQSPATEMREESLRVLGQLPIADRVRLQADVETGLQQIGMLYARSRLARSDRQPAAPTRPAGLGRDTP